MTRYLDRAPDALRPVQLEVNVNKHAEGSCLITCGDTKVMCTATVEEKVPTWVKAAGIGWVTAEYGMLPRATGTRVDREAKKGQTGRTQEIQRLIGRALRAGVDLKGLEGFQIKVDCDVLQADGGTRTASVTGGFVALYLACQRLFQMQKVAVLPITNFVAAVSCGLMFGKPLLDLDYHEDSSIGVDANFVMTDTGSLVEIQGTGERTTFTAVELQKMLALAEKGTQELIRLQRQAVEKA